MAKPIRVLIVDDSAAMRALLAKILSSDRDLEVVGVAADPFAAREKIKALNPDVMTLDIELPRMDGLTFLQKLMAGHPMPVVMISSLTQAHCDTTLQALELGAVDFVAKPTLDVLAGIGNAADEIVSKVKAAAKASVKPKSAATVQALVKSNLKLTHRVIAIGASTGGTEAIQAVLTRLPADFPGIVIVQHMPPGFTSSFARRLNDRCTIQVKEARDGDRILPGHALLAPGGTHMAVCRSGAQVTVRVFDAERVNLHKPSVDVLFDSCAKELGANATGVLLTGMGRDGALGLKRMRDAGAHTIAQNEETCVVYGMPREAVLADGVDAILPLNEIAPALAA